jgi:hypothetical protein
MSCRDAIRSVLASSRSFRPSPGPIGMLFHSDLIHAAFTRSLSPSSVLPKGYSASNTHSPFLSENLYCPTTSCHLPSSLTPPTHLRHLLFKRLIEQWTPVPTARLLFRPTLVGNRPDSGSRNC